jgi:HSP20 family protein
MSDNTQITQHDPNAMMRAEPDEARRRVTLMPAVDIVEDAHSVTVWADLPGVQIRAPYFSRRFTVSEDFDTSRIEAVLKDGVLKLTIPRRDEAKPRRIEVRLG